MYPLSNEALRDPRTATAEPLAGAHPPPLLPQQGRSRRRRARVNVARATAIDCCSCRHHERSRRCFLASHGLLAGVHGKSANTQREATLGIDACCRCCWSGIGLALFLASVRKTINKGEDHSQIRWFDRPRCRLPKYRTARSTKKTYQRNMAILACDI